MSRRQVTGRQLDSEIVRATHEGREQVKTWVCWDVGWKASEPSVAFMEGVPSLDTASADVAASFWLKAEIDRAEVRAVGGNVEFRF